jgi:manganese catalase
LNRPFGTVPKLLPIPEVTDRKFPETRPYEEKGLHRILYRFSPDDYRDITKIWNGTHPEDGGELQVQDGPPPGGPVPDLPPVPETFAPGFDPAELPEIAKKLFG